MGIHLFEEKSGIPESKFILIRGFFFLITHETLPNCGCACFIRLAYGQKSLEISIDKEFK